MTGISLGWDCFSAIVGVIDNIRCKKEDGYKTCPFDLMISNYPGVVECIKDDFKDFCNPDFLLVTKEIDLFRNTSNEALEVIYHTKYNFVFNHESPSEYVIRNKNWSGGSHHYVKDNFQEFIKRYEKRINNFREYIHSQNHITFIVSRYNTTQQDLSNLSEVITLKYPKLSFDFRIYNYKKDEMYYKFTRIPNIPIHEVQRLLTGDDISGEIYHSVTEFLN
jgi:hypothetical protein